MGRKPTEVPPKGSSRLPQGIAWGTSHHPESLQEKGGPESPPESFQEGEKLGSPPAFLVICSSNNHLQQINQFLICSPSEG